LNNKLKEFGMKTSNKIFLTAAIITIIVGLGTIFKWFGALGRYLEMLNSIQWLFIVIFATYLVVLLITYLTYRNLHQKTDEINRRLDAFNATISLAGSQSRESIDRVNNSISDVSKMMANANTK